LPGALEKARLEAKIALMRPLEINYGADIPAEKILGAFESNGRYIPNLSNASRSEALAARLMRPGDWANDFGDIAPRAVANVLERPIIIHGHPAHPRGLTISPRRGESGVPIHVRYLPDHYQTIIDGRTYDVPKDGDCFFRAVLTGADADADSRAIRRLREKAAGDVLRHPADYEPFLPIKAASSR
jgi:hypothetical protein